MNIFCTHGSLVFIGLPYIDWTTTLYWGIVFATINNNLWADIISYFSFVNGFWIGPWPLGVTKTIDMHTMLDSADWIVLYNVMHDDIPEADPTNSYQYGFVFDRDGNTNNNYQPTPDYANDFFADTDYWVVATYDPVAGGQ